MTTRYGYGLGRYGMGVYGIGEGVTDPDGPVDPGPTTTTDGGTDFPTIGIWDRRESWWQRVGDIAEYAALTFVPTFRDVGNWNMSRDFDDVALKVLTNRLYTIDFRGKRTTWGIQAYNPHSAEDDQGGPANPVLTVAGVGAYAMLGWALTWRDPTKDINDQPMFDPGTAAAPTKAPYSGPAEDVIKALVAGNFRDRYGAHIVIPASQGRGGHIDSRPDFEPLLQLVTQYATDGGLGVDVGLVNEPGTNTRAQLTLQVWEPQDRSRTVDVTATGQTVAVWEQAVTAPTATRALVAGPGATGASRFMRWPVHTDASDAAAAAWGGHREVFVDGPDSFDPPELIQAGRQALAEGAETRTLVITVAEDEDTEAFRKYDAGDTVTGHVAELDPVTHTTRDIVTAVDTITAINVSVTADNGLLVAPTFGHPEATDAEIDLQQQLRALKRAVGRQERK